MIKAYIYVIVTAITFWSLDSLNLSNLFKKNKIYSARLLYILVSMALSYLVVNFLYDIISY